MSEWVIVVVTMLIFLGIVAWVLWNGSRGNWK